MTNRLVMFVVLVAGLGAIACGGKPTTTDAGSNGKSPDGFGPERAPPSMCVEARVEGELSSPGSMPGRPFWVERDGFHVVYMDRMRGIVRATLSSETGQPLTEEADDPCPDADSSSVRAMARNTLDEMAVSFHCNSKGALTQGILLLAADGTNTTWQQPWTTEYNTMGFGWDGEGFTASLLDGPGRWGAARFTVQGTILAEAREFGRAAVNFSQYDVETDPTSGTTVHVTAHSSGVVVAGRYGRDTSLTEPSPYWLINSGADDTSFLTPAVALHGDTALVAWSDFDHGIVAREVSLPGGQASVTWTIETDQGNFFKYIAATWAKDHWVVVGQDYRGLVLAELGTQGVEQRRLLDHAPAACAATNTCPTYPSDWQWRVENMSVASDGESVWVGFVDMSLQWVQDKMAYFTYRILPLRDGCAFESLGRN